MVPCAFRPSPGFLPSSFGYFVWGAPALALKQKKLAGMGSEPWSFPDSKLGTNRRLKCPDLNCHPRSVMTGETSAEGCYLLISFLKQNERLTTSFYIQPWWLVSLEPPVIILVICEQWFELRIPLGAMKISNCHGLCCDPRRGVREMDCENPGARLDKHDMG